MTRVRNFVFTWNNYPDDHDEKLKAITAKYIVYGKETSKTGTPHLQGTIIFKTLKSEKQVRQLMPGCHIEPCADIFASITYCKKDNVWTEHGTPPKTKTQIGEDEQDRWKNILEAAQDGRVDDIPYKIRFNQPRLIEYHRDQASKKRKFEDTEEQHEWYWGEARTGKSRKAREENPEAYLKMCNKWWDGYQDETTVLIEDLDKRHDILVHHLKKWADRYAFLAEYKGGAKKIRPEKIIVTSNYHPSDIWTDDRDLSPILHRFACTQFKKLKTAGTGAAPKSTSNNEDLYLPQTHDP